jgi:hypothetical protein
MRKQKIKIKCLILLPVILLINLLIVSCLKKDLPEITQSGEETFGMEINGSVWSQDQNYFYGPEIFYYDDNTLSLYVSNRYGSGFQLYALIDTNTMNGKIINSYNTDDTLPINGPYPINEEKVYKTSLKIYNNEVKNLFYFDMNEPNGITILRLEDTLVAGTFFLTVKDSIGQFKRITNGRFDLTIDNDYK